MWEEKRLHVHMEEVTAYTHFIYVEVSGNDTFGVVSG